MKLTKLALVKHSLPAIDPRVPASRWALSDEGRQRCRALAGRLAPYLPAAIVASAEPKAEATAEIVAAALGAKYEIVPDLHEHKRDTIGWLAREAFEAAVAQLFARPGELVFGEETADQAHHRFAAAVNAVLERNPERNVIVVAHGTVISLFVARAAGVEPLGLWRRLGLPSFVVLARPGLRPALVVEDVGAN